MFYLDRQFISRHYLSGSKLFILLVLTCCTLSFSKAQIPDLQFKFFSKEDGLYSSYVNHLIQDSTGFIWIATRDGLYRFDGYDFKGYYSKQDDSLSIPGNNVNYLFSDSHGKLWVATTYGICIYNEDQDNFIRVSDQLHSSGLENQAVSQIGEDNQGNILVSNNRHIFKYLLDEKRFTRQLSLEKGFINRFLVDEHNNIWIACSDNAGLMRFVHTGENSDSTSSIYRFDTGIMSNTTVTGLVLENGYLWISTYGNGIQKYDISSGELIRFAYGNQDEGMATNILSDRKNNIWSIDFTGLKVFNKQSGNFYGYYPQVDNPGSIKGFVKGIFEDKQGNYWVYHDPGGIGISPRLKGFKQFGSNPQDFWHTSDANITSMHNDLKGNLWIGNASGGIDIFDWQQGKTIRYKHNDRDKYSLGKGAVLCIFKDSKGIMWIGSYFGGLQYFDEQKKRFISYVHNPDNDQSIAGNDIRSITEDRNGDLWIAVHGKGVDRFDRQQNKFVHYNTHNSKLSNDWTFQVLVDNSQDLWVGTSWGLNCLRKGEETFTSYHSVYNDSTSLTNDRINAIYEDNNHTLWIGTPSGLNRFNPGKNNFTQLTNLFGNNFISAILSDRENFIWLSNYNGISRLNAKTFEVKNFGAIDGLKSGEYNVLSCYKNQINDLFFGGTTGINIFNPDKLIYNTQPPYVYIDKLEIFNKEVTPEESGGKLKKQLRLTEKINIDYSEKVITISFKAINYINPSANHYHYKMENFDKDWHDAGTSRDATYTNLNPGDYTFIVKASNNDGVWSETGCRLNISILPPWYATLLFKIITVLFIIGSILVYIRVKTSNLKRQKVYLENVVREKTLELTEKNQLLKLHTDDLNRVNELLVERQNMLEQQSEELIHQSKNLQEANLELQNLNTTKDKLFSIIAHDLSSPFNAILGFSNLLVAKYDNLEDDKKRSYIESIYLSTDKLYNLLHNLLLWARSQTKRIVYYPQVFKLKGILDEVIELRIESLRIKNIRTVVNCPEDIQVWADIEMVQTILRNLLGNAIKFTPQDGSIILSVEVAGNNVLISVIDSGKGMSKEKIRQLLSSEFVKPEHGTNGEKGSGLGIALCKDFITRNNGQLTITSEEDSGSIFTFSLPLHKG